MILSAVAINAITGDRILDRAQEARNTYGDESNKEQNTLDQYSNYIDQNSSGNGEKVQGTAYTDDAGNLVIITSDNRMILVQGENVTESKINYIEEDLNQYPLDEDIEFSNFFLVDRFGYFGISSNSSNNETLYLLELFDDGETGTIERIGIVQAFQITSRDISDYLI